MLDKIFERSSDLKKKEKKKKERTGYKLRTQTLKKTLTGDMFV